MNWYITGDCHGSIGRFIHFSPEEPENTAIIILGDAGINYTFDKIDIALKRQLEETKMTYYLVRGNHEERPENIAGIQTIFDKEVENDVFIEPEFPHIKYLKDGYIYNINGFSALVLGGAYSVDKEYRLRYGAKWFKSEQLTEKEKFLIFNKIKNQKFDFIFSHTCPISFEPTDLFLHINQNSVDKSMENWLEEVKNNCDWSVWCFGHFHSDRLERPNVEMFYTDITPLDEIWTRWETGRIEWWLEKSPNYYMI